MATSEPTLRLCECGCGESIPIAPFTNASMGYVRGQQTPARFLRGHYWRVHNVPWWAGDGVSYHSLHAWLRKKYPKAGICEQCGKTGRTEYALIKGQEHGRDRSRYRELCKQCHCTYDQLGVKRGPYRRKQGSRSKSSYSATTRRQERATESK